MLSNYVIHSFYKEYIKQHYVIVIMSKISDSSDFQACVQKKIAILHAEDPKRKNNQNVAIAYSHCKKNWQTDSRVMQDSVKLLNQIAACEGVLEYNGKAFLKPWEDLKTFDQRIVPIIDEHPPKNNGNDGMISGAEKVYGTALLHQCVKGEPILCFDADMSNDAPTKNGYSIGFVFHEEAQSGEHLGKKYDGIQHITDIDHIALTNFPRNTIALADSVAGDSITQTPLPSNNRVNISKLGYDSFNAFKLEKSEEIQNKVDRMPKTAEELQKEVDALTSKLAEGMKAPIPTPAIPETDSKLKDLEKKLADSESMKSKMEADAKRYKEEFEKRIAQDAKRDIDALHNEINMDPKSFEGDSPEVIRGAMKVLNHLRTMPKSSIIGATDVSTNGDATALDSLQNYRYNAKLDKMEKVGGK